MCVKTAINTWLKKINRAINAIKEIDHLTAVVNRLLTYEEMEVFCM